MQKHLLFGLFLLLTLSASAQITRGDVLVMMNGGYGLPPAAGLGSLGGTQSEVENFLSYSSYHLNVGGTFGYALRDRLVVGAGVGIGVSYVNPAPSGGSSFYYAYTLSPLVRYYVVNREKLGVFAQAVTGASIGKGGFHGFGSLELTAGLQLPLSEGVLLTPTVGYDGQNPINVGARLELRLRPGEEGSPERGFEKGTITLGAQNARLSVRDRTVATAAEVGAQYYLTDRLAAGAQVGVDFLRVGYQEFSRREKNSDSGVGLSLGASVRYYLTEPRRLSWYVDGGAAVTGYTGTYHEWENGVATGMLVQRRRSSLGGEFFAGGGAQYMLRQNLALEAGPQLSYTTGPGVRAWNYALAFGFRVGL